MDIFINSVQNIINIITNVLKLITEKLTPIFSSVYKIIAPIIIIIFTYLISIDYYKIFTSKPFIILITTILALFLIYAYLAVYKPKILKRIIDFIKLKPYVKKDKFVFQSSMDISIESK